MNPANGYYGNVPHMMNPPPPRIFGSGAFDPSQLPPGAMFAHDDMDDHDGADGGDPKRRRIARVLPPREKHLVPTLADWL